MTDLIALRGLVDALVGGGVHDAVVCPGSRSTPLALALRAHPGITVRVLLDERSAGFFALGMAKAARRPVAVLTTSGTAAANLLPAVVEASLGRVPLILLTADRPAELRDRGAAQAIDQVRLFGTHAKWFAELPLFDGEAVTARHVRSVGARAVATAVAGPAGPVHLNVPFREPLVPDGPLGPLPSRGVPGGGPADGEEPTSVVAGLRLLADEDVERLARRLAAVERGLIIAGPQDDPAFPAAVGRLAAALDWPILADPLSLVRCGPHDRARVVARGDQLLRPGPWRAAHVPGLVLRFGAMPTSKPVLTLLEEERPAQVVVDGDGGWRDPAILPTTFVHADASGTAHALADALGAGERRTGGGRLRPIPRRGHALAGRLAASPIVPPTAPCAAGWPGPPTMGSHSRARPSPTLPTSCPTAGSCGRAARCRSATWTRGSRRARGRSGRWRAAARTGSTASSRPRSAPPPPGLPRSSSSATSRSSTTSRASSPRAASASPPRSSS